MIIYANYYKVINYNKNMIIRLNKVENHVRIRNYFINTFNFIDIYIE